MTVLTGTQSLLSEIEEQNVDNDLNKQPINFFHLTEMQNAVELGRYRSTFLEDRNITLKDTQENMRPKLDPNSFLYQLFDKNPQLANVWCECVYNLKKSQREELMQLAGQNKTIHCDQLWTVINKFESYAPEILRGIGLKEFIFPEEYLLFQKLDSALKEGFIVTASTNSQFSQSEEIPKGLVTDHAYSIVRVEKRGDALMVRLRNPWGGVGGYFEDASKDARKEYLAEFDLDIRDFMKCIHSYDMGKLPEQYAVAERNSPIPRKPGSP